MFIISEKNIVCNPHWSGIGNDNNDDDDGIPIWLQWRGEKIEWIIFYANELKSTQINCVIFFAGHAPWLKCTNENAKEKKKSPSLPIGRIWIYKFVFFFSLSLQRYYIWYQHIYIYDKMTEPFMSLKCSNYKFVRNCGKKDCKRNRFVVFLLFLWCRFQNGTIQK